MYYAPVRRCTQGPKPPFSLDLHVLSTPPAFALSQDQTLQLNMEREEISSQQNLGHLLICALAFSNKWRKKPYCLAFKELTSFRISPYQRSTAVSLHTPIGDEMKTENFTLWGCVVRSLE